MLLEFPHALQLPYALRSRLHIDPLAPSALRPLDNRAEHERDDTIEKGHAWIASLACRRLLERHLADPLETVESIRGADLAGIDAIWRQRVVLPQKMFGAGKRRIDRLSQRGGPPIGSLEKMVSDFRDDHVSGRRFGARKPRSVRSGTAGRGLSTCIL